MNTLTALGTVHKKLRQSRLYCVTQPPWDGQSVAEMARQACLGGADIIQFREKFFSANELRLAAELGKICHRFGALFIVNDRLDIALASGADGVHLGQNDLPIQEARALVNAYFSANPEKTPSEFLIGCSTHSLEQALQAEALGADYLGCGPIFTTPTKPDYKAVGLDLIGKYKEKIKIPFTAIGGIDLTNVEQVVNAGAQMVAVVRAVFGAENIESSAKVLKSKLIR